MIPPLHALVALLVARVFAGEAAVPLGVAWLAGALLPDIDYAARLVNLRAFHALHRGPVHSILVAVPAAAAVGAALSFAWPAAPVTGMMLSAAGGVLAHLMFDWISSGGAALLWPLSKSRFSLDLVPPQDPYFLGVLAMGLLPGIISEDMARWGAVYGLFAAALVVLYRAIACTRMHRLLRTLEIPGETVKRRAVFPTARSPHQWLCVIETDVNMHRLWANLLDDDPGSGDIETFAIMPPNRFVEAAQSTPSAREFLTRSRFPLLRYIRKGGVWEVSWHEMAGERASTRRARNWRAAVDVNETLHVLDERLDLN